MFKFFYTKDTLLNDSDLPDVELTITFKGKKLIFSKHDPLNPYYNQDYDLFVLNMEGNFHIYVPEAEWVTYVDDEGVEYHEEEVKWVKDRVIPRTPTVLTEIYNLYR